MSAVGPLLRLPLMDTAFPRCSMHRPRGKFSSAGWSRIQVGGGSAPPWTGDGDGDRLESVNAAGAAGTGRGHTRALLRPDDSD